MTLEQMGLIGYALPDKNVLLYHQTESFPPGTGTEKMATIVGSKINRMIAVGDITPQKQLSIFELGTGAGTFFGALLPFIHNVKTLLRGIDVDTVDLSLAKFNIERLKTKYKAEQIFLDFREADWTSWESLQDLGKSQNDIVAFNPPFYKKNHKLPSKLIHARAETIFTPDDDLYHYYTVFPKVPEILSREKGSFFIARLPIVGFQDHLNLRNLISKTVKMFDVPIKTQNIYQIRRNHINRFLILEVE